MGGWYWIGVAVGIGAALGVFFAGVFVGDRWQLLAALLLGAVAGAGVGFAFHDWSGAVGGAVGGLAGAFGAAQVAPQSFDVWSEMSAPEIVRFALFW